MQGSRCEEGVAPGGTSIIAQGDAKTTSITCTITDASGQQLSIDTAAGPYAIVNCIS